ncbi:molecular chaperone DnaJ [Fretibacterium sp. OH1220_COT-178]|uniref:molecular chaperone DnaJ n=1 Tax=Fretibacterium sp. OH1220_COT-178 TaxID=2491047 RepID=UPI000F5EDBFF|nr:molecular chaperone DnaJ [Fretibacterium sp. OH1220_COT-178]RRD65006.1 molecular chaperone DnaJ [Fretibacterium sp. OH1220_COT-178]
MSILEDLYQILGVARDASPAEIKKAYRQLARQYHPDANPGDKEAEERFKKINAAYSVLSDPEKRARYDQFGSADGSDPFGGGFGGDFGDLFGDLFSQVFGGGMGRRQADPNAPRRGADLEMSLRVSLLEAANGVTHTLEVPRWETCGTCSGSGAKAGTSPETCATCGGRGQVEQVQRTLFGQFVSVTVCPNCQGRGKTIREKCSDCGGRGQVRRKHKLEVKVPAGVERGTRLRITGAGEAGVNGGPQGDLFLLIDVEPSKDFDRDGADLHTRLLLTYPQAVLGAEVELATLIDGVEKVEVPAGTAHGQVLKIRGKGMPRLRGPRGRGDLYAHVLIDIPSRLTDRQRELITELAGEMETPVGAGEPGFFEKFKKLFD